MSAELMRETNGIPTMNNMNIDQLFNQHFADSPAGATTEKPVVVCAPGRVNLIGEHTDYNDGFVFPMALDRVTTIAARRRTDTRVRIFSMMQDQMAEFTVDLEVAKAAPKWSLYARGAAEALRQRGLIAHGMDALIHSDVPLGSGLSSSAAFEVATALALLTVNGRTLDGVELAKACQWAEHHYAGMPCGIMDQFISVMGQEGHALLLDCRDLSRRQVPLSDPNLRILVANTNVKHELVQGEYQARRNQCRRAVEHLAKRYPQVKALRDVTLDMLESVRLGMDPMVFLRATHVITENKRTTDFAAALEKNDWITAGRLMYESHRSLRDDYGVSCRELDVLVEIARSVPGVYGARMTGGGFGGCIVSLLPEKVVPLLEAAIAKDYPLQTNLKSTYFVTRPSAGARVISR